MRTSISKTNHLMLSCFIVVNLVFIVYMAYFITAKNVPLYLALNICINVALFFLYSSLNQRYWIEHDKLFSYFMTFIRDKQEPDIFPKYEEFVENSKFLSLFKRTFIEQKLLKKDTAEFKKVFDKFIPREIYENIGFRGYERIVLGTAEKKHLTIMFLDIMRFTTMSESISDPYRVLLLLNIYFDGIGEIIYRHHGYIDKYLGDGMLVIFDDDHTDEAIHAAIEIQDFIRKFQISAIGRCIEIGIGINTGDVIMGTIGTKHRMDATVIGDVVNTASRLESLTRKKDYRILITESTYATLRQKELFSLHKLESFVPDGKKDSVEIYGVDVFEKVELPKGTA